MAITKTGQVHLSKEAAISGPLAWALKKAGPGIKRGLKSTTKIPKGVYKGVRPVAASVTRGVEATGRAAAKHPKVSVPLAAIGGVGAYNFKDNFKKNWLHTDPHQNLTYAAPLTESQGLPIPRPGAIRFRDPRLADYYQSRKSDHILY